ncbi:Gfo/Idh/MocA family protein [Pseudonocardia sp. ICBG162]|uniref:Gfo/Idh/MocA family protein n=1 Tax=Pseudonocardia sp. ICBG162 TaxID=2846761 RepID=UPI001CF62179|nr:Gfo/Idh/MocA family oxidoreductase [Pseudonocardia sp. ICBG162]
MIAAIGSSSYLTRRTAPLLRELNERDCTDHPLLVGTDHAAGVRSLARTGRTVITDRDAVMADRNVDCVYISSATGRHFADCRDALAAGKHVLVEKPACLRAVDARELDRLAQAADRTVFECLSYPYHPAWREFVDRARAMDRAGPTTVAAVFRIPDQEPTNFRLHPRHGGAAADLGTYCVDALMKLGAVVEDLTISAVPLVDSDTDAGTAIASHPLDGRIFTGSWAIGDTYRNSIVVADPGCSLELSRVFSLPPDIPGHVVERLRGEQKPTSVVSMGPVNATRVCLADGMRRVRDSGTAGLVRHEVIARRIAVLESLTNTLSAHVRNS